MSPLSLALPRLAVSVEDAVAENVEDLDELVAFRVIGGVEVEDVVDVGRVASDQEVHVEEPRTTELEGAPGLVEDACDPSVVVVHVREEAGEHAEDRPVCRDSRFSVGFVVEKEEEEEGRGRNEDLWTTRASEHLLGVGRAEEEAAAGQRSKDRAHGQQSKRLKVEDEGNDDDEDVDDAD
ncbi:uncharacterized protein A4U43_C04F1740 [Asparagus officinalis]|uniref:Uncharacterized protein n=1 Tax=Asparagus officinalis TaxID=4686 RepID=A0A5P1F071_ASPOF|nr:uncharacterized protein A4U43_C04F1740 [Asparagus officinalis]